MKLFLRLKHLFRSQPVGSHLSAVSRSNEQMKKFSIMYDPQEYDNDPTKISTGIYKNCIDAWEPPEKEKKK